MKFEYKITGIGWAEGLLEINYQKMDFEVSYLCEPLIELASSLTDILPGYPNNSTDDMIKFYWLGEPWLYEWRLQVVNKKKLNIKIIYFQDDEHFAEPNISQKTKSNGKVLIDTVCDFKAFVKLIVDTYSLILKTYGIFGYKQSWNFYNEAFPLNEYLILKDFIGEKRFLKTKYIKDVLYSDWDYDVSLLK
ncbi:MAG: hypothetical protein KA792_00955 [Bacteroidales bacterium]|nr:hypothetical protein [Bacteroidales bacterium]